MNLVGCSSGVPALLLRDCATHEVTVALSFSGYNFWVLDGQGSWGLSSSAAIGGPFLSKMLVEFGFTLNPEPYPKPGTLP